MRSLAGAFLLSIGVVTTHPGLALQLKSTARIPSIRRADLHSFLATPTHWPEIVLSSHSVKPPPSNQIDTPLNVGDSVEEIFGLPPLLPLSVTWQCTKSNVEDGTLEFYSEEGVPGFANCCSMKFDIREVEGGQCEVDLRMGFEPRNPIVPLGIPFLSVDNNIALNVLLPRAVKRRFG